MPIIDANVVLRCLLDDDPVLSAKASEILEHTEAFVPMEVVCEIVYVLDKVYSTPRREIKDTLKSFFANSNISTNNKAVVYEALKLYSEKRIDFVDAILCSYHILTGEELVSFDQKLLKLARDRRR